MIPKAYYRLEFVNETDGNVFVIKDSINDNLFSAEGYDYGYTKVKITDREYKNYEVAENPDELIVYGGKGKAARNWDCYYEILDTLKRLDNDETLLIQSGKPVAVFKTHKYSPRVLLSLTSIFSFSQLL